MSARRNTALRTGSTGRWLTPLPGNWAEAAMQRLRRHPAVVRVAVSGLRGSAPREPGASMLVDAGGLLGTIGGGRLEHHALAVAAALLGDAASPPRRSLDLILGPQLGQCCGGRVTLHLERFTRADLPRLRQAARSEREALSLRRLPLWIYGAGHVGQALVRLLMDLRMHEIRWIDPRPELLPGDLPEWVTAQSCEAPAATVADAPALCHFIVLTHDHGLDYALCRAILARGDAAWIGLIGSASKAARFRSRLARDGVSREGLNALNCPIGVGGGSKLPAAIAISIAAQLLQEPFVGAGPDCGADCAGCAAARMQPA